VWVTLLISVIILDVRQSAVLIGWVAGTDHTLSIRKVGDKEKVDTNFKLLDFK